mmetsp:Transcript_51531/g.81765  ORF Transcript_51531/g.81765 Transcript_51531/m.81765 type:complete len:218 (+) Transcript_51531:94-747(+)
MRAFMISMLLLVTTVSAARIKRRATMVYESGAAATLNTSACDPVNDKYDAEVNAPDKELEGVLGNGEEVELLAQEDIMGVAYGPAFAGKGQIIAWTFTNIVKQNDKPDQGLVLLYYPKPNQIALDEASNLAGLLSCGACPSCSRGLRVACYADKKKMFAVGSELQIGDYVSGTLRKIDARYRLEVKPNCHLHHIWIKHSSCAVPVCEDESGDPCDCQ